MVLRVLWRCRRCSGAPDADVSEPALAHIFRPVDVTQVNHRRRRQRRFDLIEVERAEGVPFGDDDQGFRALRTGLFQNRASRDGSVSRSRLYEGDHPLRHSSGLPQRKQGVHIRLDADILAWFKSLGPGYQTRINSVLRSFVQARRRGGKEEHGPRPGSP